MKTLITLTLACSLLTACASAPAQPAGRAAPISRTTCPATHPIKGNRSANGLIFHAPGGEFYARTAPEDCFSTAAAATTAGYRRSQR